MTNQGKHRGNIEYPIQVSTAAMATGVELA